MSPRPSPPAPAFERWVVLCCDWLLSQRSYELIVAPALADLEFEVATRRRATLAGRIAVLRALAGGIRHEMMQGSAGFLKLTLLSACYYVFPIALSVRMFETWTEFLVALLLVFVLSLTPVLVCFWPARRIRQSE
jgi:hypothetical protein